MAQGVGPEFKPQYYTKQNKNPQIILWVTWKMYEIQMSVSINKVPLDHCHPCSFTAMAVNDICSSCDRDLMAQSLKYFLAFYRKSLKGALLLPPLWHSLYYPGDWNAQRISDLPGDWERQAGSGPLTLGNCTPREAVRQWPGMDLQAASLTSHQASVAESTHPLDQNA
jgi:hypothetical protein